MRGRLLTSLLALFLATPALADGGLVLPPMECVQMMRAARLERMRGDTAGELAKLRAAVASFPEEMAPLEHHRRNAFPWRSTASWLVRRLEDPRAPEWSGMGPSRS